MPKSPTLWMVAMLMIAAVAVGTVVGEGVAVLSDALVAAFTLG
jgi:hypothetical protein